MRFQSIARISNVTEPLACRYALASGYTNTALPQVGHQNLGLGTFKQDEVSFGALSIHFAGHIVRHAVAKPENTPAAGAVQRFTEYRVSVQIPGCDALRTISGCETIRPNEGSPSVRK